jgi:endonuclease/exonuclease/phosphatase family metal-dependent hydrolase
MLKVATFNVENLFDRPKIINLEDHKESSRLLKLADKLQQELKRATYRQSVIEELLTALKGFVSVRVDSGSFFKGQSRTKISAKAAGDWVGGIEFVRMRFDDKQRANTAEAIRRINADVMCMVEVEGRQVLTDFCTEFFEPAERLSQNMLIDSPIDPRGIDIALAWRRAQLGRIRSNAYDVRVVDGRKKSVWSRDCLEIELGLADGKVLHCLCNHFKSKMGGDPPDAQQKRTAQSQRLAEILHERYDLRKDMVVVLGDLNDTPSSAPLAPLLGLGALKDVFDIAGTPKDQRWTYYYHRAKKAERKTQIDYVLVSEALAKRVSDVSVHREGMSAVAQGHVTGVTALAGVTDWSNAASDHAAIAVDFDGLELPGN